MAAREVSITEVAPGRVDIHVDGTRIPHVTAYTVTRRVGGIDVVTIELQSQATTMTPAPSTNDALAQMAARDAEIDARIGGTVGA